MCLQSKSELACVEPPVLCCLPSTDLHEWNGIICTGLDEEGTWKEAG